MGCRRSEAPRRPTLDGYVGVIDEILRPDKALIKKQRHTAKRIFDRLRDEHEYAGSLTTGTYYARANATHQGSVCATVASARARASGLWRDTWGDWQRRMQDPFLCVEPATLRCGVCEGLSHRATRGVLPLSAASCGCACRAMVVRILGDRTRVRQATDFHQTWSVNLQRLCRKILSIG
jgi:hypothetical protein